MLDIANDALSWLGQLLNGLFDWVAAFFLQWFPEKNVDVMNVIRSWGDVMRGYDLTFNLFYFVDMNLVAGFFNLVVVMLFAYVVYILVQVTIRTVSAVVEMIPVVE